MLKTILVLLLLALVPIRAFASVTTGFCALTHEQGGAAVHAAHAHDSHEGDAPVHPHDFGCGSCVEHCASAAFAPPAPRAALADAPALEPTALDQPSTAGFIADHLDPPPLAA